MTEKLKRTVFKKVKEKRKLCYMVRVIVSTTEPPLFINLSWWGFSRFDPNFKHCGLALYPIIGFQWLYCRMMEKSWCPNLRLLGMQWVTVLSCSTVEKHKYHSAAVYHVLEINQTNTSWLYQLIRSLAIQNQRWYVLLTVPISKVISVKNTRVWVSIVWF